MGADEVTGSAAPRSSACPLGCGYDYPIPACVRLHLIQHHDCTYAEAQEMHPDEPDYRVTVLGVEYVQLPGGMRRAN